MLLASVRLAALLSALVDAQYETYSFRSFPPADVVPLESAYNYGLEQYGAKNWAESIKYLELSLRLHRLLRDSEAFCSRGCGDVSRGEEEASGDGSLRVMHHVLLRAACLKKCKGQFPVFSIAYPRRSVLETFEKRIPYRYLQYAQYQVRLGWMVVVVVEGVCVRRICVTWSPIHIVYHKISLYLCVMVTRAPLKYLQTGVNWESWFP